MPVTVEVEDNYPFLTGALVGDSAVFTQFGPISGRRWRLDAIYALDPDAGGALYTQYELDYREYIPVSQRSNLALRVMPDTPAATSRSRSISAAWTTSGASTSVRWSAIARSIRISSTVFR